MEYDVVIVGAGPAGLGAAIKLKQMCAAAERELSVCVVEKGAEVGAHILSGNVFEPRALDELFPDWKEKGAPVTTKVTKDDFVILLSDTKALPAVPEILLPPQVDNHKNYVISLNMLCRWLGEQAEELGVEVYPGFAASEVLYAKDGGVMGVATRDAGIEKDGSPKATFARGMELKARQTIFAEGCRGSCSEELIAQFSLRDAVSADPQSYALGIKEIWEIPEANIQPGLVMHTYGWPLQSSFNDKVYGGAFLYHMEPNLVLCGFVTGLDYENPYLSPYQTFQQWKTHPKIRSHLEGGERVSYGARVLNEGGYYSVPKLTFPGGMLVGCSAGFLNAFKIKGSHTALKSGMIAAEAVFEVLSAESAAKTVYDHVWVDGSEEAAISEDDATFEVVGYGDKMDQSWVMEELKETRNFHGAFKYGTAAGLVHSGLIGHITKGREPWSLRNTKTDAEKTKPAAECKPIDYPKPDGIISFDILSNLAYSGTNHEDQPSHLRIKEALADVPAKTSLPVYDGPEQRFCPAKVYEYDDSGQLIINSQNCVHCKCCSIKMPSEYIQWTVPEGGGGPAYTQM